MTIGWRPGSSWPCVRRKTRGLLTSVLILVLLVFVFVVIIVGVPISQREQHLLEAPDAPFFLVNHNNRHHHLAVGLLAQDLLDLFQNVEDLIPQLAFAVFQRLKLAGFLFAQVNDDRLCHCGVCLGGCIRRWCSAGSCHVASRNWTAGCAGRSFTRPVHYMTKCTW